MAEQDEVGRHLLALTGGRWGDVMWIARVRLFIDSGRVIPERSFREPDRLTLRQQDMERDQMGRDEHIHTVIARQARRNTGPLPRRRHLPFRWRRSQVRRPGIATLLVASLALAACGASV